MTTLSSDLWLVLVEEDLVLSAAASGMSMPGLLGALCSMFIRVEEDLVLVHAAGEMSWPSLCAGLLCDFGLAPVADDRVLSI